MERASAPAIADFKRLSRLVKKYRKIYETQYQAIRNKTLAHTEVVDDTELAALYAKTNIRDLERLLIFLNKFHKALWEYQAGLTGINSKTTISTAAVFSYAFTQAGNYVVVLTVTNGTATYDGSPATGSANVWINVS